MPTPKIATAQEWQQARDELLEAEKVATARSTRGAAGCRWFRSTPGTR